MPYNYKTQRAILFTDEGQRLFLQIRDKVRRLCGEAGACRMGEIMLGLGGDSWTMIASVDRMIELGELEEVTPADVAGQSRIFHQ